MAYKALYREYRPQTFDEVVGQKYIVQTLQNQLKNNKVSHAYIFTGPRGTGKTTIARLIAKGLNCSSFDKPCGECENCISIAEGTFPDVIEIDAASNNSVDDARDLIEKVKYAPVSGKYKVYIIDEVHMLSPAAFNALLKTFEEPPENVIFILATTDIQKVPTTILSRCQRFDFGRISQKDLENKLIEVTNKENIEVEDGVVNLIAALADGGVRDALGILDQAIAYQGNHITVQDVRDIYGVLSVQEAIDFLKQVNNHEVSNALKTLDKFATKSVDIPRFTTMLIDILKETIVFNKTDSTSNLALLNEDNIYEIADFLDSKTAFKYIDILLEANQSYKLVNTPRSYFELAILKLCNVESSLEVVHHEPKIEKEVKEDEYVEQSWEQDDTKEENNETEEYSEPVEEYQEEVEEPVEENEQQTYSEQSWEDNEEEEKQLEEDNGEEIVENTESTVISRNSYDYDDEEDEDDEYEHKTVGDLIDELGAIDYEIADDWEGFEVYIPVYEEPMLDEYPTIILVEDGEPRLSTLEESFNYQRYIKGDDNSEDELIETVDEPEEDNNKNNVEQSWEQDETIKENNEAEEEYSEPVEESQEEVEEPVEENEQQTYSEQSWEDNEDVEEQSTEGSEEEQESYKTPEENIDVEEAKEEPLPEPVLNKPVKSIVPITVTQELIFNFLVQSDKQYRLNLLNIWNSLSKYVTSPIYARAANTLRDGVIVAAGQDCIVISMDLKAQAEIANSPEMYLENKALISELFGKEYKYIATYTDEYKSYLVKFKEAYLSNSLPQAKPVEDLYDIDELKNYKVSSARQETDRQSDTARSIFGDMLKIK